MKNNCATEFDLNVIYHKLTQPSNKHIVKACNFFDTSKMSLIKRFQQTMSAVTSNIIIKK